MVPFVLNSRRNIVRKEKKWMLRCINHRSSLFNDYKTHAEQEQLNGSVQRKIGKTQKVRVISFSLGFRVEIYTNAQNTVRERELFSVFDFEVNKCSD